MIYSDDNFFKEFDEYFKIANWENNYRGLILNYSIT